MKHQPSHNRSPESIGSDLIVISVKLRKFKDYKFKVAGHRVQHTLAAKRLGKYVMDWYFKDGNAGEIVEALDWLYRYADPVRARWFQNLRGCYWFDRPGLDEYIAEKHRVTLKRAHLLAIVLWSARTP